MDAHQNESSAASPSRRHILGAGVGLAAMLTGQQAAATGTQKREPGSPPVKVLCQPVLIGSANALPGMLKHFPALQSGSYPLDVALEVVKIVEADPNDHSVGLGGMPNENGVMQLDAAVMDGRTHNAGSVGCIENILHPCEVARLVMERSDHVMLVGRGAYDFARAHGHAHTELLTDAARVSWLRWKETMSTKDDRFPAPTPPAKEERHGSLESAPQEEQVAGDVEHRITGTIHCSALSMAGEVACTTTTSGLAWKIPGRVGDSPIIGAGLYCDAEVGSAGATGRGEAAILSHGSSAIIELLRHGATPLEAGMELMARVTRQARRASLWQPGLVNKDGVPTFNLSYYILGRDGSYAGVRLKGKSRFAVATADKGARIEPTVAYLD